MGGLPTAKEPVYRFLDDKSIAEFNNTTSSAGVETILWNKQDKQQLNEVIHDAAICIFQASKLYDLAVHA